MQAPDRILIQAEIIINSVRYSMWVYQIIVQVY